MPEANGGFLEAFSGTIVQFWGICRSSAPESLSREYVRGEIEAQAKGAERGWMVRGGTNAWRCGACGVVAGQARGSWASDSRRP